MQTAKRVGEAEERKKHISDRYRKGGGGGRGENESERDSPSPLPAKAASIHPPKCLLLLPCLPPTEQPEAEAPLLLPPQWIYHDPPPLGAFFMHGGGGKRGRRRREDPRGERRRERGGRGGGGLVPVGWSCRSQGGETSFSLNDPPPGRIPYGERERERERERKGGRVASGPLTDISGN